MVIQLTLQSHICKIKKGEKMEIVDLIDENGNIRGGETRKNAHKQGLMHMASGLIIFCQIKGKYFLLSQQRSYKKEKNAGLWDISASGHIPSGETPLNSLIREAEEELGLTFNPDEFTLLGKFWRHEVYSEDFIENELDYIYIIEKNIDLKDITIQEEEVENAAYIEVTEFKNMLKNRQAVNREGVWEEFFKYLDCLDNFNSK